MYKIEEGRKILKIKDRETHHNDSCTIHLELDEIKERVPVKKQNPEIRNKNFDEICLGYNIDKA